MPGCRYHNIDAHPHRPGCYTGYGGGLVWRIYGDSGGWVATMAPHCLDNAPAGHITRITAPTLGDISRELENLK